MKIADKSPQFEERSCHSSDPDSLSDESYCRNGEKASSSIKTITSAALLSLFTLPTLGGCKMLSFTPAEHIKNEQRSAPEALFGQTGLSCTAVCTEKERIVYDSKSVALKFHSSEPISGEIVIQYRDGKPPRSYRIHNEKAEKDFKSLKLDCHVTEVRFEPKDSETSSSLSASDIWYINDLFR